MEAPASAFYGLNPAAEGRALSALYLFWTVGNKGEIHVSRTGLEKDSLEVLLERARRRPMDQKERVAQRRSFAFGNAAFENPRITRQMIEDEERKMSLADE